LSSAIRASRCSRVIFAIRAFRLQAIFLLFLRADLFD
jgi:hypothetical protein